MQYGHITQVSARQPRVDNAMDDKCDWLPSSFDGLEWWRQASAEIELLVIADSEEPGPGRWLWVVRRMDGNDAGQSSFGMSATLDEAKEAAEKVWKNSRKF